MTTKHALRRSLEDLKHLKLLQSPKNKQPNRAFETLTTSLFFPLFSLSFCDLPFQRRRRGRISVMASVINRGVAGRMSGLLQHSFNLIKSLSTSTSPTSSDVVAPKKSKRRKKKNLFEVAQFLPNWGIGYKMAKNHWIGISYEITKINLYKGGRHGKAWGIFHKDGLPAADAPKKISGVHKRGWRYIPDPKPTVESTPTPRSEVQT